MPTNKLLERQVCGNCRHFERFPDTDQAPGEDITGECLLHPPRLFGFDHEDLPIQQLPVVTHWHRCGQHEPTVN